MHRISNVMKLNDQLIQDNTYLLINEDCLGMKLEDLDYKRSFFNSSERNECSSNPCQNSGTCVDKIADYQCTCLNGFTGKNCEIGE